MMACRLAQAGARVLILEAGSRNPSRATMVGSYATAPAKTLHSPYGQAESDLKAPSPDSSPTYFEQPPAPHTQYKSTYERRTGGSTWHWLGHTPRMLRSDFEMRSRYGGSQDFPDAFADWPISYKDLEPWYCQAEKEMGVAGSHEEWNNFWYGDVRRGGVLLEMRVIILAIFLSSLAFGDLEQKGESRVHVSEAVGNRLITHRVRPTCPDNTCTGCDSAEVALKLVIEKSGAVKQITVVRAGDSRLAEAALDAVRQWRYGQYLLNGRPVEYETHTTIKSGMCAT